MPYFYRTSSGAEIDLLLDFSSNEKWAIDIKRSSAPSVSKGFYLACEDVRADKAFVIYVGKDEFPVNKNGTRAIPLHQLMKMNQEKK
jgi:predicted AAA+ superfamily ATPase